MNKDFKSNINYKRDLKSEIYNNIGLDQRLRDLRPQKDISKFKATDVLSPVRIIGHLNGYYKKERRIQEFERKQNILNEIEKYASLKERNEVLERENNEFKAQVDTLLASLEKEKETAAENLKKKELELDMQCKTAAMEREFALKDAFRRF